MGFSTNTAEILFNSLNGVAPWMVGIDNTFITLFIQFGLVGTIYIYIKLIKIYKKYIKKSNYKIIYLLYLIAIGFSQNIVEAPLSFLLLSITLVNTIKEKLQKGES